MRSDWMEDAACAGMNPDLFFSDYEKHRKLARAACQICPVVQECGEYAIENREGFGIWGGTHRAERISLGMSPPPQWGDWVANLRGCGSRRGVEAHRSLGSPLCRHCQSHEKRYGEPNVA